MGPRALAASVLGRKTHQLAVSHLVGVWAWWIQFSLDSCGGVLALWIFVGPTHKRWAMGC